MKSISLALCVVLLLTVHGHTNPSAHGNDPVSGLPPSGQKNEIRKKEFELKLKKFEPARRMLMRAGVPFEPSVLLTQNWRTHLAPQFLKMPDMEKVRRVTQPLKGVYLANTLYLAKQIEITGDTVILVRHLVFTNGNTLIRGRHNLFVFPIETSGVLDTSQFSSIIQATQGFQLLKVGAPAPSTPLALPLKPGGKLSIDVSASKSIKEASVVSSNQGTSLLRPVAATTYDVVKTSLSPQGGQDAPGASGTDGAPGDQGSIGADGGTGSAGASGSCETTANGADGGPGGNGDNGGNGGTGRAGGVGGEGGTIFFTVPNGSTMSYFFNVRGGDGGTGGDGGPGGRGGNAGRGGNGGNGADCPCSQGGAGDGGHGNLGGNGGRGGNGGNGGPGGNGGLGGEVYVTTPAGYTGDVDADINGGRGGTGGRFGSGGTGGSPTTGGLGGAAGGNTNCPTDIGNPGGSGASGLTGAAGSNGSDGAAGTTGRLGLLSVTGSGGCSFEQDENPYQAGGGYDCTICRDGRDNDCNGNTDYDDNTCYVCIPSPIVIDVLGDGFNLTSATDGIWFDITATGSPMFIGWIQGDDAWLALDRDANGTIDSGAELFGNFTPQPQSATPNGFIALAEYDKPEKGGNADGRIGPEDSIFPSLRLWQDRNHNGISEPDELYPLLSLDVRTVDLDYKESRLRDEHGNQFRYRAKVYDAHGAKVGRWAWDVFLVSAP